MKIFSGVSVTRTRSDVQEQELMRLRDLLRAQGRCTFTRAPGAYNMDVYDFGFNTPGQVNVLDGITGAVDMTLHYVESQQHWDCAAHAFGVLASATDPKSLMFQIQQGVHARAEIMVGFFTLALQHWERYRGDIEQFTYKLGTDLNSMGQMDQLTDARLCAHWHSGGDRPKVDIWFSRTQSRVGFAQEHEFRYGFFENPATHVNVLSLDTLEVSRAKIFNHVTEVRDWCIAASACFGQQ